MKESCALPALSSFVTMLKACGHLKDIRLGSHIHAEASRKGLLNSDSYLGSALVDMYAKCGELAKAQEVFDALPLRDVVTWTTLVSGYALYERGEEALHHFEQMQHEGILPNAVTFVSALKACGSIGAFHKGMELHSAVLMEILWHRYLLLGSTLVDMYAKCGILSKARAVFDALLVKDVVTWTALMAGYAQHGHGEEALESFDQMQLEGVSPNAVTYVCSLNACGSITSFPKAIHIHCEVERRGILTTNLFVGNALVNAYSKCGMLVKAQEVFDDLPICDKVSWNTLIAGYTEHGRGEEALDCFRQMQLVCVTPDDATFTCILKACGSTGAATKGREIHAEIARRGMLAENAVLGSALIDMFASCGLVAQTLDVFVSMETWDQAVWGALIAGYAQFGDVDRVVWLFDMMREGSVPNSVAFVSILRACSHAGLVGSGVAYFMAMSEEYGVAPTLEHHTCMVDLFGRAGQLGEAVSITSEAPFRPDSVVWLSMLGSCRKQGNLVLGEHAFQQAVLLNEKEAAACISMSNMYTDNARG